MLDEYIKATNDTSILERALPLAELELEWWLKNRTISVTSSYTSKTYNMSRYAVVNSAPRPESYFTDYETATGVNLTEQQRSDLYAELATGAESGNTLTRLGNFDEFVLTCGALMPLGWDYTSRWLTDPLAGNSTDQLSKLRTLNIRNTIPVDLNSILCMYRSSPYSHENVLLIYAIVSR